MPLTISTVPKLLANLRTALAGRSGLAGVQVSRGWPQALRREDILIGDVDMEQHPVTARSGRLAREERYTVEITVRVERPGVDQATATSRAFEIAAEIEDSLRSDPTVTAAVRFAEMSGAKLEEMASREGRLAILIVRVACQARI